MEREERRDTLLLRSSGMHSHYYRILAELTWVGRCGSHSRRSRDPDSLKLQYSTPKLYINSDLQ